MIKINRYKIQTVEHYDGNGNFIGYLNESENLDLRCQIAENKIEGYYIKFCNQIINIQKDGKIKEWPFGLYDTNQKLNARLFHAQK
jgi:hypothetical protein